MCTADIFLGLLAILFPPLPVWVKRGLCSADSLINILLCVLGYIPGLIHAWYIIARFPDDDYDDDYERGIPRSDGGESGRVTYVFVQPASHAHPSARRQQRPNKPHDQRQQPLQGGHANYGTANTNADAAADAAGPSTDNAGEGGSNGSALPPPTYAEAVKGDYKVQTQD